MSVCIQCIWLNVLQKPDLNKRFALLYCQIFTLQSLHIPPCFNTQSKVRDLEEKCRVQSEQFGLLSQELENFRLQASKVDLTGSILLNNPSFSVLTNGVGLTTGRGELFICVLDAVSQWFCLCYIIFFIGNRISTQQFLWCFFEVTS